ncbi:uncharacterized protein LOC135481149 [Liolophura sinensis]|uniref:uncharacterized protein LOC135481149 n=1 Tax=Liolophura sinensis TaxID=3198878 RepID=UPI0031587FE0
MRNLGKMGVALAVAVVFLTSDVMSKPRPCLQENNEYYNSHLGCHKCDPCPPGEEPDYDQDVPVDRKRGALRCSACRPCQPGTYSKKASRQRCSLCRNCEVLSRHTNQPCTATQNAVCGKCLPGHHDVYKRKYNSSLPQYDKACQSCNDTAHKTVPECASTTLPTVREEEGRTYHNANVDKEALVISENSQDSAFSAALTSDVMSKPRPCLQENNEYYNSHLGCHKCDPCPPGEEPDYDQDVPVDRKRGALRCSACRPCQPGTYSKKPSRQRCNLCRNCEALSRHTNQPCTATQNAVCGKCLPGHHDVYKRKYNSSLPQYDKACQSCNDTAHKTAQECASTTLPTAREQEGRTYHNANVGKEEPVISENPQDSAFHMTVVTGMPYVMAIVLVLLVIAVAVFMRKSITSRRQKTPNLEVELGKLCPVFPGENQEIQGMRATLTPATFRVNPCARQPLRWQTVGRRHHYFP